MFRLIFYLCLHSKMKIKEVLAKSILSPSKIYDYVVNPYVGCQHACSYCYARFMKRFTGHKEPWGDFVDVKINAPDLLTQEVKRKKVGTVWVSGVCDPYQPLEKRYKLARRCLEILVQNNWPVVIQTRSSLVLRDLDIFKKSGNIEVGLSITTANDEIRKKFEPYAPPVEKRLNAIETLHQSGIRTYVMIPPILPEAENLIKILAGKVDYIIIDRMNYFHADKICEKHGWRNKNTYEYFNLIGSKIVKDCARLGIECRSTY
jgi:DNA repair photolyase